MFNNATKVLQYLALTPAVIQLVVVLVNVFETEGNGEAKKKAVLDMVEMVYNQLASMISMKVPITFVRSVADKTIDIAVNFFNLIGEFQKSKEVA